MKIREYKVIRTGEEIVPAVYDEDGEIITEESVIQRDVYGVIERDATPEEEATIYVQEPAPVPSIDEQIAELKAQLEATDYKAIKYAEGWLTEEEYAPIKAHRQAVRDRINELEATE